MFYILKFRGTFYYTSDFTFCFTIYFFTVYISNIFYTLLYTLNLSIKYLFNMNLIKITTIFLLHIIN